jgi:hypothetical protein
MVYIYIYIYISWLQISFGFVASWANCSCKLQPSWAVLLPTSPPDLLFSFCFELYSTEQDIFSTKSPYGVRVSLPYQLPKNRERNALQHLMVLMLCVRVGTWTQPSTMFGPLLSNLNLVCIPVSGIIRASLPREPVNKWIDASFVTGLFCKCALKDLYPVFKNLAPSSVIQMQQNHLPCSTPEVLLKRQL